MGFGKPKPLPGSKRVAGKARVVSGPPSTRANPKPTRPHPNPSATPNPNLNPDPDPESPKEQLFSPDGRGPFHIDARACALASPVAHPLQPTPPPAPHSPTSRRPMDSYDDLARGALVYDSSCLETVFPDAVNHVEIGEVAGESGVRGAEDESASRDRVGPGPDRLKNSRARRPIGEKQRGSMGGESEEAPRSVEACARPTVRRTSLLVLCPPSPEMFYLRFPVSLVAALHLAGSSIFNYREGVT